MKCFTKIVAVAMTCLIGTFVLSGSAYAQVGADPKTNARHSRVVGLWDVDVMVVNCVNGAPVSTFSAMHKYEFGGTGQVVPNGSPTSLSAHMMIWSHVRNNDYQLDFKMFRFDANGNYNGWVVVRNEISISEDAQEYVGSGVAEFYNSAGTFLFSSCPSFIGSRFTGE